MMETFVLVLLATIAIGVGFLALTFGRRLYAVFVGVAGVALTVFVLEAIFGFDRPLVIWLIALIVGGVLGYFAPRLENIALPTAGFVLGGFVANYLLVEEGRLHGIETMSLLAFLVGGAIGAYGVYVARDRALIVVSSLIGAALITGVVPGSAAFRAALFSGFSAAGMIFQSRSYLVSDAPDGTTLVRLKSSSNTVQNGNHTHSGAAVDSL